MRRPWLWEAVPVGTHCFFDTHRRCCPVQPEVPYLAQSWPHCSMHRKEDVLFSPGASLLALCMVLLASQYSWAGCD